jgi:hypothetical protein
MSIIILYSRSGIRGFEKVSAMQFVKYSRNGRAFLPSHPHLGSTAGAAAMAALYVKATKDWYFVEENPALIKGTFHPCKSESPVSAVGKAPNTVWVALLPIASCHIHIAFLSALSLLSTPTSVFSAPLSSAQATRQHIQPFVALIRPHCYA